MDRISRIKLALEHLCPTLLEVTDDSAKHAGHAGVALGSTETHFTITIQAPFSKDLTLLAKQRLLNQALAEEFARGLHAVIYKIL